MGVLSRRAFERVRDCGVLDFSRRGRPLCRAEDRHHGQCQRQQPQVVGPFDIVLDAPIDRAHRLAERVLRHGRPGAAPDVEIGVVGRIAVEIGQEERDDLATGPGPIAHLLERGRSFTEALAHQIVERDELHRAERQAQTHHDAQPEGQTGEQPPGVQASPRAGQPPRGKERADEQDVVGDLDVPGQRLHPHAERAGDDIGHRRVARGALVFLLRDNHLNQRQDQRQPGGGRDHHGEVDADDVEAGEGIGDRRDDRPGPTLAQRPRKDEHARRGQSKLERRKDAVGLPEGQDVEDQAERIERRVLAGRQKGQPREDQRIPEDVSRPAGAKLLDDERLPLNIFQHQVADQRIVGDADAELPGVALPRLVLVQVVCGQQGAPADGLRPEP